MNRESSEARQVCGFSYLVCDTLLRQPSQTSTGLCLLLQLQVLTKSPFLFLEFVLLPPSIWLPKAIANLLSLANSHAEAKHSWLSQHPLQQNVAT